MSNLEEALRIAALGWAVFPIEPGWKDKYFEYPEFANPETGSTYSWLYQASSDPERVKRFWTDHPDANIGVAAGAASGGLICIDMDVKNGVDGIAEFEKYTSGLYMFFGHTCSARTPSGGKHTLFIADIHHGISGFESWLPGVDIRANGNYFVVSPSCIDGRNYPEKYEWDDVRHYEWELDPEDCEPLSESQDEAVEMLMELLQNKHSEGEKSGKALTEIRRNEAGKVVDGCKHSYVVKTIGEYVNRLGESASDDAILELVVKMFNENCENAHKVNMSQFRRKYLKTISKFKKRRAEANDPEFDYSYGMKAWKVENPGKTFQASSKAWESVRAAGQRAKEAGKTFEQTAKLPVKTSSVKSDKARFHLFNDKGRATGVFDYEIHKYLKETQHILILGKIPYIYKDGAYKADLSGAILKTMIRKLIYSQFVRSTTVKRIYDLFIDDAELQTTYEDLNQYPPEWICFRNGFFDPVHKCVLPHNPKYKAINQIPYDYDPEADPEGETVKEWLDFITPKPDDREMLLQFAGYCLTRDTRQQKFMVLRGEGGTGKSTVINLIMQMIGPENITNISLAQLMQRFAAFNLMGKLLNSCADLEVTALEDVSTIKKIIGEDPISAEAKGKDPVNFRSYAKLIFSTNELPIVKTERTNGFYRRLLILRMDRLPEARSPDFYKRLSSEIDYFIHECVKAVCRMYGKGLIVESAGSRKEVQQLRWDSDTVEAFLAEKISIDSRGMVPRAKLYESYASYCTEMERQSLKKTSFFKAMRAKGFSERKANVNNQRGIDVFSGITFGKNPAENPADGFMDTEGIENPFDPDSLNE